jgi:hypothetical protein
MGQFRVDTFLETGVFSSTSIIDDAGRDERIGYDICGAHQRDTRENASVRTHTGVRVFVAP